MFVGQPSAGVDNYECPLPPASTSIELSSGEITASAEVLLPAAKRILYEEIAVLSQHIWKIKTFEEDLDSLEEKEKILQKLDTGSGYWNCCDRVSAALPWSGRKHSGFGVTLSHAGLRAFTKPKAWHLRSK